MMFTTIEKINKKKDIMCGLCNKLDLPKLYIISNEINFEFILCPECKKAFAIFLYYNMTMISSNRELLSYNGHLMSYDTFKI